MPDRLIMTGEEPVSHGDCLTGIDTVMRFHGDMYLKHSLKLTMGLLSSIMHHS